MNSLCPFYVDANQIKKNPCQWIVYNTEQNPLAIIWHFCSTSKRDFLAVSSIWVLTRSYCKTCGFYSIFSLSSEFLTEFYKLKNIWNKHWIEPKKKDSIFIFLPIKKLENGLLKVKLKTDNVLWSNKITNLENFGKVACNKLTSSRTSAILLTNSSGRCLKVGTLENRIKRGIRI